jgi:hypothetical protein
MNIYIAKLGREIEYTTISLNMLPYMNKNELIALAYMRGIRIMPDDTKSFIMDIVISNMLSEKYQVNI